MTNHEHTVSLVAAGTSSAFLSLSSSLLSSSPLPKYDMTVSANEQNNERSITLDAFNHAFRFLGLGDEIDCGSIDANDAGIRQGNGQFDFRAIALNFGLIEFRQGIFNARNMDLHHIRRAKEPFFQMRNDTMGIRILGSPCCFVSDMNGNVVAALKCQLLLDIDGAVFLEELLSNRALFKVSVIPTLMHTFGAFFALSGK
jgi:hypothetical protein